MMKRLWAFWLKQVLFTLGIVFVLGVTYDHYSEYEWSREPLQAGLITVALYIGITAILALFHALVSAAYTWAFSHSDVVEGVLADLRSCRLPAPRPYDDKTISYLSSLADDEHMPTDVRVRAAVLFGQYKQTTQGGLFRGIALNRAIDKAILRYASEGPQLETPDQKTNNETKWSAL